MSKKLILTAIIIAAISLAYSQEYTFYALSNELTNTEPVYLCKLDGESGSISSNNRYSGVVQGNYFALSPDRESLLVTSKNKSRNEGGLVQYRILEDGGLVYEREQFKPGGLPCHVSFTPDSGYVLSANYGDDEISLYDFSNQQLSPEIDNIVKADQSKGHYISTDPSGKFVHAVFLGLNKVYNYSIENDAFLENPDQAFFSLPDGFGPRHMVFHPEGDKVYIVNETHSSVTACSYDSETGVLSEIQNISMLPEGYTEQNSAAAIRIHPDGSFLYASNRGHNSIVVYKINPDGSLVFVEHETAGINFPRDFNISPDGKFMLIANQKGNTVISLSINESTGELTNTGFSMSIQKPQAIEFLPAESDIPSTFWPAGSAGKEVLTVFPNPARDFIQVTFSGNSNIPDLKLYNMAGQPVTQINPGQTRIMDVSGLPRGIYILKGQTLDGSSSESVLIY